MKATRINGTPMERFVAKVEVGVCMEWTGATSPDGYGIFHAERGTWRAHRWMWVQLHGPIPDGIVIDHLCRNRRCVDPAHLRLLTHRENMMIGHGAAPTNRDKTHCDHGHEFTPENTYVPPGVARRDCRECARRRQREGYHRRAARAA